MSVKYLEVVSDDAEQIVAMYEKVHGLSFSAPEADLGEARVATRADGSWIGIRKPLAAHEKPVIRTYLAVDDSAAAAKAAEASGALVAYGPVRQGKWGMFAILIQGGVEHGLWQA